MNWKLILQLSLFGLAMAIGTVYFIPPKIEPTCWFVIFIFCAYKIAKDCDRKYFLHGFMVSMVNVVWRIAIHAALFDTFMSNHPEAAARIMNLAFPDEPLIMMVGIRLIIGIILGTILGLFSFVAARIVKKSVV